MEDIDAQIELIREQQVDVYVTKKCCGECLFFPQTIMKEQWKKELLSLCLQEHRVPECHYLQVARMYGRQVPEMVVCFGFFYCHMEESPVLQQAVRDRRIRYFDITGMPGLRESGLQLYGDPPYS